MDQKIQIIKTGILEATRRVGPLSKYMILKASRTHWSHYQIDPDQNMISKLEGLIIAHELQLLHEDPEYTKGALN
jgi:hypothetical protein